MTAVPRRLRPGRAGSRAGPHAGPRDAPAGPRGLRPGERGGAAPGARGRAARAPRKRRRAGGVPRGLRAHARRAHARPDRPRGAGPGALGRGRDAPSRRPGADPRGSLGRAQPGGAGALPGGCSRAPSDVEILGVPAGLGAELRIDGRLAGALPLPQPLRLEAGVVTVEVRAPGRLHVVREVAVHGGLTARETFDLAPLERPSENAVRALPGAPPLVARPSPVRPGPSLQRVLAWTAAGGAAIGDGCVVLRR